jgi:hypothetical protein
MDLTRLSDREFDAEVSRVQQVRAIRATAAAFERAMHTACGPVYARYIAAESRPEWEKLFHAYVGAGVPSDAAMRKVRELGLLPRR